MAQRTCIQKHSLKGELKSKCQHFKSWASSHHSACKQRELCGSKTHFQWIFLDDNNMRQRHYVHKFFHMHFTSLQALITNCGSILWRASFQLRWATYQWFFFVIFCVETWVPGGPLENPKFKTKIRCFHHFSWCLFSYLVKLLPIFWFFAKWGPFLLKCGFESCVKWG